jgi:hypothetical protein
MPYGVDTTAKGNIRLWNHDKEKKHDGSINHFRTKRLFEERFAAAHLLDFLAVFGYFVRHFRVCD